MNSSQKNVFPNDRGLKCRGLKRTWSQMNGLKWIGLNSHGTVTSCYQVHALNADAHLSAALHAMLIGATGAETSLLLTAYCIE